MKMKNNSISVHLTLSFTKLLVFVFVFLPNSCVSNAPPDPTQYFSVREEQPSGIFVGTVGKGQGLDIPPPFEAFSNINDFAVNLTTGNIRTNKKLDREVISTYLLVFYSTNTGTIVQVYVNVTDENDHAPHFPNGTKSLSLSESTPPGTKIIVGSVMDQDIGQNGIQNALIISGNDEGYFDVGLKQSGSSLINLELVTKHSLDYETKSEYNLLIRVYDGGDPPKTGDVRVDVNVIDANDNPPQFVHTKYSVRVNESVPVGTSIARVEATDQDSGDNAKITYTLKHLQNPDEHFSVEPDTGIVRINKPLDYETTQQYELTVVARDNGPLPGLSSEARIEVIVENINEKPATINLVFLTTSNQSAKIAENATYGTLVVRISVSDPDHPNEYFSNINVSLQGDLGHFGLKTSDNVIYFIYVKHTLDRETTPKYDLNVVAVDSGNQPLHATSSFTLWVSDINDNAPEFTKSQYTAEISEQSAVGTSVTKVSANDKDEGINAKITYRILDTPDSNSDWFQIDSNTGFISTRVDKTDCELNSLPRITVEATDSGKPQFTSTATVLVTIHDVNDMEPEFQQSFYKTSFPEDKGKDYCFLQVSASDPDCNGNAHVTYHLANLTQSTMNVFKIDSTTGWLCVDKPLDYETQKIYEFPVYATDSGGLDSSVIVSVNLEDVNDNRPQFYPQNYSTNINVNRQPGQDIITVQALDADSGNFSTIHYFIAGGNDDNLFNIGKNSGKVQLINALPQEEKVYILQISATDGGGLSSLQPATIYISVTGANIHPPVFDQATYRFSVEENVRLGTSVGSVSATVPSAGNSDILYTITSGDIHNFFTINQQTGEITTRVDRLHHHQYPSVLLGVKAEAGNPPVYGSTQVNITISDVNDHAPEFIRTSIEITVFEDQDLTTTIYMAQASDEDSGENGTVHYRLSVNPSDTFRIDTISGEIRLNKALDYETIKEYVLIVNAFDQGTPSLSKNLTLTVKVSNVNDNPPVFTKSLYLHDVKETAGMDTNILEVVANDADNDQVTYTLLNEDSGMFGIHGGNGGSGMIYLRSELDRETRDSYTFKVQARDNGKQIFRSATADVKITVTDANDNNPVFSQTSYEFYVEENNTASAFVGQVVASDKDTGANAELEYTLIGNENDFTINSVNGKIRTTKTLDRETQYMHQFSVQVSDKGDPPRNHNAHVKVVVRDINDNSPQIENSRPLEEYVDENKMKGTQVIKIKAKDPDDGENGTVTYTFDQASSDRSSLSNFNIHPVTGMITTAEVLDYETRLLYTLTVIAKDNGNPSLQTSEMIRIRVRDDNDEKPIFPSENKTFEVQENTAVGSIIATVEAFDKDSGENGRISYYLVEGNVFGLFSVNISTGDIYCIRDIDYEESSSHTIGIKAIDNGIYNPKSSVISVLIKVIDLNDNPPEFDFDPIVIQKKENLPIGQIIYTFTATDSDSGLNGTVFYKLKEQNPNLDLLELNGNTGALTVKKNIDYEKVHQISLVVEAHDLCHTIGCRKATTLSVWLFIEDENDNPPVFKSYVPMDIKENEPVGYRIVYVVANDADRGQNGQILYSIDTGNEEGKFDLNSQSGLLSIKLGLDREAKSKYTLNLMARDQGATPLIAYTSLTINVIDVNNKKPTFKKSTYTGVVNENTPAGEFILVISATDDDIGDNSKLTYSLPKGVANDRFLLDASNGRLTTKERLDREEQSSYVLTAFVRDGGNPSLYDSATIIINVKDKNDNSPIFEESEVTIKVPENAGLQTIHRVLAHDKDSGDNGQIFYTIEGGNTNNAFEIDSETGDLRCNSLDREAVSSYNLTIGARDQGQPSHKAFSNLIIEVLDKNDNAPAFTKESYSHNIPEDIAVGSTVLLVVAMDVDEGDNKKITYSLGNDTEGQFQINSVSGEIITSRLFDYERKTSYTFNVVAKDGGGNVLSSTAVVTIGIEDKNDNRPIFTKYPYKKSLSNGNVNTYVTEVTADDKDSGNNGLVKYRLIQGGTSYFRIDSQTGIIFTNMNLPTDRTLFNVRVVAEDSGSPVLSSTGVVLVTVGSQSTSGLRFMSAEYTKSMPEHSPPQSEVKQVIAQHYGGVTGTISYNIVSGNQGQTFSMDSQSGMITVHNYTSLDYEHERRMKVVVSATDGLLYDYATVWVELTDINDNAPQFAQSQYYASVQEHASMGAYVTQVLATDIDDGRNANITYNIIGGNAGEPFKIEPIYSGIVKVKYSADRETKPNYQLTIEAKDGGSPSVQYSTCQLYIEITDINDQPPNFPNTKPVNISEAAEVGTLVALVTANDVDNPVLQYGFVSQGNPDSAFTIEKFSGKIRLAKNIDHESRKQYALGLVVTDGKYDDHTTLNVYVDDENDNSPVFSQQTYHVNLPELSAVGTTLMVDVNATDADSGSNAQITYSIVNDETGSFHIDSQSGKIKTTQELIFNPTNQIVTLTVMAQDSGTPARSTMVAVKVNITQVNQSPPVFALSNYTAVVSESMKIGYSVIQVTVTGIDQVTDYSIISGHDNKFRINQKTGIITVNGILNREVKDKYVITVSAVVRGTPSQTTSTNVDIIVDDVNDVTPEFTQSEYSKILPENYNSGQIFLSVSAKDDDIGINAEITYSITSGNDDGIFDINDKTGSISIATGSSLDYETDISHKLIVSATDCGRCQNNVRKLSAYSTVQINVTDINDNVPHFPQPFYYLSIRENMPNMSYVGEVHANDKDAGPFGILTYQMTSARIHNNFFHINSKTGNIYTKHVFDYENLPILNPGLQSYELKVIATDSGGQSTNVPVVILISDVDEFNPVFFSDKFTFAVPGNAKPGHVIGQVNATDKDGGDAGKIFYTLSDTNDYLDYFGVNVTTGQVFVKLGFNSNPPNRRRRSSDTSRVKRALDQNLINLVVTASSGVTDSNKATAVLEISIDESCAGCTLIQEQVQPAAISTTVIVIIVLVVIVLIVAIIIVIIITRYKFRKTQPPVAQVYEGDFNDAFDFPTSPSKARDAYNYNDQIITPDVSEQSHHSASSGRGSVEADEDDEVMRINSQSVLNNSSGYRSKNMPDSGLPDDDNLSEPSVQNSKDYLAKLGIDTTITNKKSKNKMQSMDHYPDEGGGDSESINISEIDYSKFGPINDTSFSDGGKDLGFHEIEPHHEGTISNVINSEEEYSGSYNWDYLLDWGPQYQPLAHVFVEIARLKDDSIQPKKQPVQTVPQRNINTSLNPQVKMVPPPIITNAPPTAVPQPIRSSHGASKSNRTNKNMTTSFQNMPRSPIAHESSFTSPALTPSFTPSLSPLATRSPEPSYNGQNMVHSHQNSNRGMQNRGRHQHGNGHVILTHDPEEELRI